MRSSSVCAVLLFAACAKAGAPGGPNNITPDAPTRLGGGQDAMRSGFADAAPGTPDAPPPVDAPPPPIDAPPPPNSQTVTLTETTNNTVAANDSIACVTQDELGDNEGTTPNTYYRVFDLSAQNITTTFTVDNIAFAVEDCDSANGDGCPNIAVRVGTYSATPPTSAGGKLTASDISLLASATVNVPEIDEANGDVAQTVTVPVSASIPGSSELVAEVDAPDGTNTFNFFIGASEGGQSALGYLSTTATGCSPVNTTPTDIQTLAGAGSKVDVIISVTGTFTP